MQYIETLFKKLHTAKKQNVQIHLEIKREACSVSFYLAKSCPEKSTTES